MSAKKAGTAVIMAVVGSKTAKCTVTVKKAASSADTKDYLDVSLTHLSSVDNCEEEFSLEVSAQAADGFPQGAVRTVSEICRTLRVENFGFEK